MLASDLGSLLLSAESSGGAGMAADAVLRVEGQALHVHRCVLVARAEYFRALFLGDFAEAVGAVPSEGGSVAEREVVLEDVEIRTMRDLLWCLHTGEPPDAADSGLVALLGAAHRFGCVRCAG